MARTTKNLIEDDKENELQLRKLSDIETLKIKAQYRGPTVTQCHAITKQN